MCKNICILIFFVFCTITYQSYSQTIQIPDEFDLEFENKKIPDLVPETLMQSISSESPDQLEDCINWVYEYKTYLENNNSGNYRSKLGYKLTDDEKKDFNSKPIPKPFRCVMKDLFATNLKYVGKVNLTNSSLNIDQLRVDENGNVVVDTNGDPLFDRTLKDETNTLFSVGFEYNLSVKDLIGAFNQNIKMAKNYYLFDRINLADLKFNSSYKYSNTAIDNNQDDISVNVKTEDGFKYELGVNFTGCIGDLFNFKLGCFNYDGINKLARISKHINEKRDEIKKEIRKEKEDLEKQKLTNAENEIKDLKERIEKLERLLEDKNKRNI